MADPSATPSNVPDPHVTMLEAALEHERQISRDAQTQVALLQHRESQIAIQHRPIDAQPISASGWTIETLMTHQLALREGDRRFYEERDRRYAEVNVEKEKALKIKETAALAALQLAREIQTYKDEKANQLREQINSERGLYATKDDLDNATREIGTTIKPLLDYVSGQQGGHQRGAEIKGTTLALLAVLAVLLVGAMSSAVALIIHG